jgi:hypothetical protein
MPKPLILKKPSALDLSIEGTIGDFSVATSDSKSRSINVKYILTHSSLTLDGGHNEKLISNLVPVREIFDNKNLDFDEIMQRDIDDSRISLDLIPYLLEEGPKGLVKLFPPIVAVVVPLLDGANKPAPKYPETKVLTETIDGVDYYKLTSGETGSEAFAFQQIYLDGVKSNFSYATLKVNSNKSKLVIVDGQHRAMALLALYRNLRGWPESTLPYKSYYKKWTSNHLDSFDLKNIQLPVMICTLPELHSGNTNSAKVTEACRSIFLALNKNAKPVTKARNILLDDRDLISEFLRTTLAKIKNSDTEKEDMGLHNIQLDSDGDKQRLTSEFAISGVMHLYHLLEKLLFEDNVSFKLGQGRTHLGKIKYLTEPFKEFRLNGINLLGSELAFDTERANYTNEIKEKLCAKFKEKYGDNILYALKSFSPYRIHNKSTREILRQNIDHSHIVSILSDNQGVESVFDDFRSRIKTSIKDSKECNKDIEPGLKDTAEDFDITYKKLELAKSSFRKERAKNLLTIGDSIKPQLISAITKLYSENFTTSAFQSALILTFYFMVEDFNENQEDENKKVNKKQKTDKLFKEYITSLNMFFDIQDNSKAGILFKTLLSDYKGTYNGDNMEFRDNDITLRSILIPGELNPGEWSKFRYILLELWHTEDADLKNYLEDEIKKARKSVFTSYRDRSISEHCKNEGIEESAIDSQVKKKIIKSCAENYTTCLNKVTKHHILEKSVLLEE